MTPSPSSPPTPQNSWLLRHPKTFLLIVNVFILLLAEVALRISASAGLIAIVQFPTSDPSRRFLGDIKEHFGVWHYPNRKVTLSSPCFEVEYASNSYGARDSERKLKSSAQQRVVVLGDSFVEGYGVNISDRMTNIAEQKSGIEFLNFGVSGNFGSIQQWLLYQDLAQTFDHSDIAIFFLPSNDFADNDPKNFPKERYRPYLRKNTAGTLEVYYTVPFEKRKQTENMSASRVFRRELYNKIYLLNVIRQLGDMFERSELKDAVDHAQANAEKSSYEEYSTSDLESVLHSFGEIAKLAGERRVSIFVIPRPVDFAEANANSSSSKIVTDLNTFAAQHKNVRIVDLLPEFLNYLTQKKMNEEDLFLQCDGHWSALGNQVAADVMLKAMGLED